MAKQKQKPLRIVQFPDPVLFIPCSKVINFDKKLHDILDEMSVLMEKSNGIGLSANQVEISKSFFIMKDGRQKIYDFINPIIIEQAGQSDLPEGCLSLLSYIAKCNRSEEITVKAQNRYGEEFTVAAYGIESVCIQHEIDHLNGIFFTSKEIK
jgi:peptide deformylase